MSSRALTIRQPWASLVIHAGKDVENRGWRTRHRGELLIHAGLYRPNGEEVDGLRIAYPELPQKLPLGAIIGTVDLAGCVRDSDSEWAQEDAWHWLLSNPRPLDKPLYMPGKLGLWCPQTTDEERKP